MRKVSIEDFDYEAVYEHYEVGAEDYGHTFMPEELLEWFDARFQETGHEIVVWENGEDREWVVLEAGVLLPGEQK